MLTTSAPSLFLMGLNADLIEVYESSGELRPNPRKWHGNEVEGIWIPGLLPRAELPTYPDRPIHSCLIMQENNEFL